MKVSESLIGMQYVGKEYTSKVDLPKVERNASREGRDILAGERFKVLEFNWESNEFKLLNLSLGTPEAWFIVTIEDLVDLLDLGM